MQKRRYEVMGDTKNNNFLANFSMKMIKSTNGHMHRMSPPQLFSSFHYLSLC